MREEVPGKSRRKSADKTARRSERYYLDGAEAILSRARAAGVSPSLTAADMNLARRAWEVGNAMISCAAAIEAGDGDQQEHWQGLQFGTLRERAAAIVAVVDELPLIKHDIAATGDAFIVTLKPQFRDWFTLIKKLRKTVPRDLLVKLFTTLLVPAADRLTIDVYDDDLQKLVAWPAGGPA